MASEEIINVTFAEEGTVKLYQGTQSKKMYTGRKKSNNQKCLNNCQSHFHRIFYIIKV